MKPHELLQRQRRNKGKAAVPPQMRARNNAQPQQAAAAVPARRPTFPGETREQELQRLRAAATVVRPGPAVTVGAAAAVPPAEPEAPTYTLCSCPAHDGECGHVATLGAVWPMAAGVAAVDLCERCARAIKAGPVGELVTGLQFVALQAPTHDDLPEEGDAPEAETETEGRPPYVQPVEGTVQP